MNALEEATASEERKLSLVACHATILTPEAYWNDVLPNTSMPTALRDLIERGGEKSNNGASAIKNGVLGDSSSPLGFILIYYRPSLDSADQVPDHKLHVKFFLESDLRRGKHVTVDFTRSSTSTVSFLDREDAEKIPFTSKKIPEILKRFSVKSDSSEANILKSAIKVCEDPVIEGVEKYCATSLESMVDFATSKLGKNIDTFSTESGKEIQQQGYIIQKVKNISKDKMVSCHQLNYAYPVFYCHKTQTASRLYEVPLIGADGTRVKAVTVCHVDTSAWNPNHLVFQELKVKPGTVPICHFLLLDQVIYVPK